MSYVDDMYENAYTGESRIARELHDFADKLEEAQRDNEQFYKELKAGNIDLKPEKETMKTELKDVLQQRGDRYGSYPTHALISQDLKTTMQKYSGYERLSVDQKESLEMIAHKIARILNGDPNYDDSWVDIAGYATLIAKRLQSEADK